MQLKSEVPTRPDELSTTVMHFSEGTNSDRSCEAWGSCIRCCRRGTLLRGSFRGRFDSMLMMRWLASRCFNAATTWVALKDGLIGT